MFSADLQERGSRFAMTPEGQKEGICSDPPATVERLGASFPSAPTNQSEAQVRAQVL